MSDILVLQHHPEEGLGFLQEIFLESGHRPVIHRLDLGAIVPENSKGYAGLVIMGGPMSVNDHDRHPWLVEEMRLIREAVEAGMPTLGHCLGAQLIAKAMGGQVFANPAGAEIGWFPVEKTTAAHSSRWLQGLPESFPIFHWHGETFSLPGGGTPLLSSALCAHQAFAIGQHCLALQGHPEVTASVVRAWTEAMADDLQKPGAGVQSAAQITRDLAQKCAALAAVSRILYAPWVELLRQ
ncbi:type 1 glutamine amidotransferase [Acidithiobacillus sp.]